LASTETSRRVSERVERALELYRLIFLDGQATASREAELARLINELEMHEVTQYYTLVRPMVRQLSTATLLKRAAEETEWS
jgi:hypothetical protein